VIPLTKLRPSPFLVYNAPYLIACTKKTEHQALASMIQEQEWACCTVFQLRNNCLMSSKVLWVNPYLSSYKILIVSLATYIHFHPWFFYCFFSYSINVQGRHQGKTQKKTLDDSPVYCHLHNCFTILHPIHLPSGNTFSTGKLLATQSNLAQFVISVKVNLFSYPFFG